MITAICCLFRVNLLRLPFRLQLRTAASFRMWETPVAGFVNAGQCKCLLRIVRRTKEFYFAVSLIAYVISSNSPLFAP